MKILRRGPAKAPTVTYEFECKWCKSLLRAKDCELRPYFGGTGTIQYYLYMCPVCHVQRTVNKEELTELPAKKHRIWEFMHEEVKEANA